MEEHNDSVLKIVGSKRNMSQAPTGKVPPLYHHVDGPIAKDIQLPPVQLDEQARLATQYLEYSSVNVNVHAQNIRWVAWQVAIELERACNWLNEYANQDDLYFHIGFLDGNTHGACIEEPSVINSTVRDCLISMRLGGIPLLIGIANRLNDLSRSSLRLLLSLGHCSGNHSGVELWDPETDPVGITTWEGDTPSGMGHTLDIVINALLLMFFHEASHGCAAHGYISKQKKFDMLRAQYHRAMEMEADWGAGQLFVKYRAATAQHDEATIVQQLLYGSQCNYLALQVSRGLKGGSDSDYHLPHTRTRCTLEGAQHAWKALPSLTQDFVGMINDAYQSIEQLEKLFPNAIRGWLPYDSARSERDLRESRMVSIPLIRLLRKSHIHVRARPLDEFPDHAKLLD